mgnify:FL=1
MKNRVALRLPSYDYREGGAYFVTICTFERRCVFGEIRNGVMGLNRFGCIVWNEWKLLSERRPYIILDEMIVMPNHVHLILFLQNETSLLEVASTRQANAGSLGDIMRGFKSGVSREIARQRGQRTNVWQQRFHDRVIRDERELENIRRYIQNNPLLWQADEHFQESSSSKSAQ